MDRVVRKRRQNLPVAAPLYPLLHGARPSSEENPRLYPAAGLPLATAVSASCSARHCGMPWTLWGHSPNPGSVGDEARGTVCVVLYKHATERDVERVCQGTCLCGVGFRERLRPRSTSANIF